MEYVVLRAVHPTWLTTNLPAEVARLLRYDTSDPRELRSPGRGIAFLARGPGIVRVVASFPAREVLAVEIVRNRYLAPARLTDKLLFNLPGAVQKHLGVQTQPRGENGIRATDDTLIWFLPAPEYYEFRARDWAEKPWTGPSPGGFAHVYLARSILPMPKGLDELAQFESKLEAEEWKPRVEALARVMRPRRA